MAPSSSPSASLRTLLTLAWPIVLARATQSVVGFADALMVVPLGEDALAAVTTGALNTFAFIILPMGTVFIVQSFAAQLRGQGRHDALRRHALYGLFVALLAAMATAAFMPFLPKLVGLLGHAPGVERDMNAYLSMRLWSVGAAVGVEALGNWYGGLGNTRPALVAGVTTMLTNIVGNYLLIEPRLGLPGYGPAGAGLASTIASFIGFGALLYLFLRGRGHQPLAGSLVPRAREFWRVVRFGLPNGVNWFLEFSAFMVFVNLIVGQLGTTALAALNVVIQINSVSFMPAFGLASAGAILVGEAIGRGAHREVWPLVRLTGSVAAAWMIGAGLVYFSAPGLLMSWFSRDSAAAQALVPVGASMLTLSAIWQLFDALGLTLSEALRAAGDTAWCMAARIVLAWLVFAPAAWLFVLVWKGGVTAAMLSLAGYLFLLAVAFAWRFGSGRWKRIDLTGAGEPKLV